MALEGMDVEVVGNVYHQMSSLHQQLQGIVSSMPHLVSELEGSWKGPDAQQFAAQWPSHQAQLQAALAGLQDICTHTQANLQAQETASNTY